MTRRGAGVRRPPETDQGTARFARPRKWTPTEATAVLEVLDEIREWIWLVYGSQIQQELRRDCEVTRATEPGGAGEIAAENFAKACGEIAKPVAIEPGDVLLVNNRLCLHGRAEVGGDIGGHSRWLLRTYALNTAQLDNSRRHLGDRPAHVL